MIRFSRRVLAPLILFIGGLGLWEMAVATFDIKGFILPPPTEIIRTFWEEAPTVLRAGQRTLTEAIGGLAIGSIAGVLAALLLARSMAASKSRVSLLAQGIMPLSVLLNSTPIIALAPIANNWFGVTNPMSKMSIVAVLVFFPILINTVRGLTEVDPGRVELMTALAAPESIVVRKLRVPNALPYLFASLKVAGSLSMIGAIVSEYFGGLQSTLGSYIAQRAGLLSFAETWAGILVAVVLGLAIFAALTLLERVVVPWTRPS